MEVNLESWTFAIVALLGLLFSGGRIAFFVQERAAYDRHFIVSRIAINGIIAGICLLCLATALHYLI